MTSPSSPSPPQNAHEHEAHLSQGQLAMLAAYPQTWKLHVYPTRRSASYPQWVYDAVRENATSARVILDGKGSVEGARVSSPFPIPSSGVEVIWNHNLRWRGVRITRHEGETAVTRKGRYNLTRSIQEFGFPVRVRGRDGLHPPAIPTSCSRSRRRSTPPPCSRETARS